MRNPIYAGVRPYPALVDDETWVRTARSAYSGDYALCSPVRANKAVTYAHRRNQSLFSYDPRATASKAYAQPIGSLPAPQQTR